MVGKHGVLESGYARADECASFFPALLSRTGASKLPMNRHSDGARDEASIKKIRARNAKFLSKAVQLPGPFSGPPS